VQCVDRAALLHRLWKLQSSLLIEILVHSAETKGPEALQARVPLVGADLMRARFHERS
jgi:hypothetical protein